MIEKLNLEKNVVILKLEDPFYEEDGASGEKLKLVEIDLHLSAHANARNLYMNRKHAKLKEQKTAEASMRVIQNVENAAQRALEAQKLKRNLNIIRYVHWFEKFNWFITSEGYLCLSGRDAQQNELLVKRYLRSKDIYVHADLAGASSCVVRCRKGSDFISPYTLQQAGAMAVCRSGAWSAKATIGSYWVYANQVSKSAPSGEYLVTGSFMIYGKKNYIPPMPLEMGFGILFRLDDDSISRHHGDRRIRGIHSEEGDSAISSYQCETASDQPSASVEDCEVEKEVDFHSVSHGDEKNNGHNADSLLLLNAPQNSVNEDDDTVQADNQDFGMTYTTEDIHENCVGLVLETSDVALNLTEHNHVEDIQSLSLKTIKDDKIKKKVSKKKLRRSINALHSGSFR